jgi:hypothetical protein
MSLDLARIFRGAVELRAVVAEGVRPGVETLLAHADQHHEVAHRRVGARGAKNIPALAHREEHVATPREGLGAAVVGDHGAHVGVEQHGGRGRGHRARRYAQRTSVQTSSGNVTPRAADHRAVASSEPDRQEM